MKTHIWTALALLLMPVFASAQVYSYNTHGGQMGPMYVGYSGMYGSHMPAMSYGNSYPGYGYDPYGGYMQMPYQSYQYQNQMQYQYQSAYQYQPSYSQNFLSYYNNPNQGHVYPYSYSRPTGDRDAFGTPLCYWSDYPSRAPCGQDPQQWIYDPYTGQWY